MSTKKQSKQPTRKQLIETCQELDKGVECVRGFLEKAEAEMKHLSSDGTLSTEGETCLGCRLQGYAEHNHACMKVIIKENDKLEEENEKLKEELLEALSVAAAAPSVGEIKKLKEEIENLKSQIPDKKGKKLSQNDKEILREILGWFTAGGVHHNTGNNPMKVNLLKRLMK